MERKFVLLARRDKDVLLGGNDGTTAVATLECFWDDPNSPLFTGEGVPTMTPIQSQRVILGDEPDLEVVDLVRYPFAGSIVHAGYSDRQNQWFVKPY